MGIFATFWSWLNAQLATYIGANTARLAAALEPALATAAVIYVMGWGYLHLTGQIEEPVAAGLKRILVLALVFGVGLNLWLYNSLIVDTFYDAPAQLAAAVVGARDPVGTVDAIWSAGGAVAGMLWTKGGALSWGFMIAAVAVWCLMGLLCVYVMFLIALSNIALAVLLALGPLFIALFFFETTKRMFSAWLAQLATYALVTVLTVMMAALLLQLVESYAAQTLALGSALKTVDSLDMLLVTVLVFLILRQIMPIAAALAGGISLSTLGALSRPLSATRARLQRAAGRAVAVSKPHLAYSFARTGARLARVPTADSGSETGAAGAGPERVQPADGGERDESST